MVAMSVYIINCFGLLQFFCTWHSCQDCIVVDFLPVSLSGSLLMVTTVCRYEFWILCILLVLNFYLYLCQAPYLCMVIIICRYEKSTSKISFEPELRNLMSNVSVTSQ